MSDPRDTNGARVQTPEHKRLEDARTALVGPAGLHATARHASAH
ncbi:MAG TPA: hypothetical protein VK251_03015 [Steroidobacteraceae bacterium]|nr:hypothetical protein [Steroidobacteraceae bacterium]